MKIIFTAFVCTFTLTIRVTGSLSIEGKALIGLDLPSERENLKYLSGIILESNFLRGYGIFISIRHFLTVARSLTKSVEENGPVYVNPEDLIIVSPKYVHEILNFETHPDHTPSSFLNDIAVLLVKEHTYFGLLPNGKFPLEFPNSFGVNKKLELFAFTKEANNNSRRLCLKLFPMTLLSDVHCAIVLPQMNMTDHFCASAGERLTNSGAFGSPLLYDNLIMGLFLFGQDAHSDSAYVNIFFKIPYIKEAQERLGC